MASRNALGESADGGNIDSPAHVLDGSLEQPNGLAMLNMSQAELAEFVGATRESVSKTLAKWKRIGLIEASRGGLLVLDRSALIVLAQPDQI